MEDFPVIIIVTSKGCPPCFNLRGETGVPGPADSRKPPTISGGYKWDIPFFKNLVKGNSDNVNFRVYEIFVDKQIPGNLLKKIISFAEFKVQNDNLIREIVKHEGEDIIHSTEKNGKQIKQKKYPATSDLSFTSFIESKIPRQLENFVQWFPFWGFIDGDNYNGAINGLNDLYLVIPNVQTILSEQGEYKLDFSGVTDNQSLSRKINFDPLKFASLIVQGTENLKPAEIPTMNNFKKEDDNDVVSLPTGNICSRIPRILPYQR